MEILHIDEHMVADSCSLSYRRITRQCTIRRRYQCRFSWYTHYAHIQRATHMGWSRSESGSIHCMAILSEFGDVGIIGPSTQRNGDTTNVHTDSSGQACAASSVIQRRNHARLLHMHSSAPSTLAQHEHEFQTCESNASL